MTDYAEFTPGDKDNPRNWPSWRKWSIIWIIVPIDLTVSWGASGFSPAETKFEKDFGVSAEVATLGLSLYVLGLAFGPMTLAPLSEYFGRSAIYIGSYGLCLTFFLGTALVQNLGGFLVLRLLSGLFSAVTIGKYPLFLSGSSSTLTSNRKCSKFRRYDRGLVATQRNGPSDEFLPVGSHVRFSLWLLSLFIHCAMARLAGYFLGTLRYLRGPMDPADFNFERNTAHYHLAATCEEGHEKKGQCD